MLLTTTKFDDFCMEAIKPHLRESGIMRTVYAFRGAKCYVIQLNSH